MKYALALAAALAVSPALAQDKPEKAPFTGCYAEASAAGQSQVLDNRVQRQINQLSTGTGCTVPFGEKFVTGTGTRVNVGSGSREIEAFVRGGYLVNSGLLAYGMAGWTVDARNKALDTKSGVAIAGAGVEFVVMKDKLNAFLELERDLLKIGDFRDVRQQTQVRAGVRVNVP